MNIDEKNFFTELGLPTLLVKNLLSAGIKKPNPIQEQAVPMMLKGKDVLGIAQTGSGKTLAFSLPILSRILAAGDKRHPKTARALILAPTRELAVQIEESINIIVKGAHLSTCLILGGVSRFAQIKRMKSGVDVLVATPGRLMDLVREKYIDLSHSRFLVLDEADRMLDMGFVNDVQKIAKLLHEERQTVLFSATMPKEVTALANNLLNEPVKIEVAPQGTTAAEITQKLYCVPVREKKNVLNKFLTNPDFVSVVVFTRTKHGADAVARYLERAGHSVAAIHGNKSHNARQCALKAFREGAVKILVATDIAARGLDIPGISHVINYDLPDEAENYVHRIGRTGRNGAFGEAITLFDEGIEQARLHAVERLIRAKLVRGNILPQFAVSPEKPFISEGEGQKSGKSRRFRKLKRQNSTFNCTDKVAQSQLCHKNSSSKSARHKKAKETAKRVRSLRLREPVR
ncbi:ATP-dependent RNA helicase RhlE [Bartonella australis AUST/NH1]|uniref:ATP-dependent RNA helicase RhlE n=1 Tax=Bartonella australis (strain Aust/NH1) TaxID=1094489 RepID=M1NZ05_BARAA|nr:DEAD/DEAH box helicase [Bartonella australis]AGF74677.1 ATP-dependent RNA helicase RhlE [Bartonella australis AUST/NH1]